MSDLNSMMSQEQQSGSGSMISIENSRAMQEIQGVLVLAKKFPRDLDKVMIKIEKSCKFPLLAEAAEYAIPRGKGFITGMSIRLAEVLVQCYGNCLAGVKELQRNEDSSECLAYCWDVENNLYIQYVQNVPHYRSKNTQDGKVRYQVFDDGEIRMMVFAAMAKLYREAVKKVVPVYVQAEALDLCRDTMEQLCKNNTATRIKKMVKTFSKVNISEAELEQHLKHPIAAITPDELNALLKAYNALRENLLSKDDFLKQGDPVKNPNAGDKPGLDDKMSDSDKTNGSEGKNEDKTESDKVPVFFETGFDVQCDGVTGRRTNFYSPGANKEILAWFHAQEKVWKAKYLLDDGKLGKAVPGIDGRLEFDELLDALKAADCCKAFRSDKGIPKE